MPSEPKRKPREEVEHIFTHNVDEDYEGGSMYHDYRHIKKTMNEEGDLKHEQVGNLSVNVKVGQRERIGQVPHLPEDYDDEWYEGRKTSSAVGDNPEWATHSQPRQGRLFPYTAPTKPEHEVHELFGTKEDRVGNMTMLGMAENAAREEGATLLPSTDLSQHSSRLVGKLKMAGVVDSDASTRVTNDSQFHEPWSIRMGGKARVPAEEVEAGRQTVRKTLKDSKPRQIKGQQTLF
jgi:hypothetical protein